MICPKFKNEWGHSLSYFSPHIIGCIMKGCPKNMKKLWNMGFLSNKSHIFLQFIPKKVFPKYIACNTMLLYSFYYWTFWNIKQRLWLNSGARITMKFFAATILNNIYYEFWKRITPEFNHNLCLMFQKVQ